MKFNRHHPIIEYLVEFGKRRDIDVVFSDEFGHIIEQAVNHNVWSTFKNYDSNNPDERTANSASINILLHLHFEKGGQFNYIDFMYMYGLPAWTAEKVKERMINYYH